MNELMTMLVVLASITGIALVVVIASLCVMSRDCEQWENDRRSDQ